MPTRRHTAFIGLALTFVLAAGCSYPAGDEGGGPRGEGPGGREQPLALSPAEELNVGRRAYREVMSEYRDRTLPASDKRSLQVRQIVERLARAAEIEPLQREINLRVEGYKFEWEVAVVRDRQVNAMCLPAGKMVVFTGIIDVAANENQLATVLAHEMAHALAHHGSERVARENTAGGIFGNRHYDRYQESEADKIGIFLMPFAGYNPDEAANFWARMQQVSRGGDMPEVLSTHPSHGTRIKQLRAWSPQAKAAKQAFDEGRILRR